MHHFFPQRTFMSIVVVMRVMREKAIGMGIYKTRLVFFFGIEQNSSKIGAFRSSQDDDQDYHRTRERKKNPLSKKITAFSCYRSIQKPQPTKKTA